MPSWRKEVTAVDNFLSKSEGFILIIKQICKKYDLNRQINTNILSWFKVYTTPEFTKCIRDVVDSVAEKPQHFPLDQLYRTRQNALFHLFRVFFEYTNSIRWYLDKYPTLQQCIKEKINCMIRLSNGRRREDVQRMKDNLYHISPEGHFKFSHV